MVDQLTTAPTPTGTTRDILDDRDLLARLYREGVQREVANHLANGHNVYYCGTGSEANKLFFKTPAGRRFEYRIGADGNEEILREVMP